MSALFNFLLGVLVGALLWQWFGMKVLGYVFRKNPVILRSTIRGLDHDAFQRMKHEVENEDLRRKEE